MKNSLFTAIATTLLLAFNVMGQEAKNPAPTVANVQITPSVKEAEVGQDVKLTVVATDASGNVVKEQPSTYFAGPFDIAAPDDNGNVKLFGTGEVTVGAIVGGKPGITTFMVKAPSIKTIEIHSLKKPIVVGGSMQLDAVTRIFNGDPRTGMPINWTSDNPQVATVDAGGVVTGVGPGKATITATSGAATATTTVAVNKNNLRSMTITAGTKSARTGDVIKFSAQGDPAGDFSTRWSVSGNGATIDADGSFLAEQPGTYIITGTSGNLSSSTAIVVSPRNLERELELVGRAPMKEFQGAEQWIIGNYAYYSTIADRFFVYDISDPANPKLTDTIKVDARIVNDISTTADGKILVISREGASNRKNGIAFYDTSDPAHPKLISEYTTTVTGGVHSAFVDKHYVYLTDDATGSMRVIDLRDPYQPREVARWETPRSPAGRMLHDIAVDDGLAYLSYWNDGLVVLDVGNGVKGGSPERPVLVSQFKYDLDALYRHVEAIGGPGFIRGTHTAWRQRNYVFVADEVFSARPARTTGPGLLGFGRAFGRLQVIDVSDLERPRSVAWYEPTDGGTHNIWVAGDTLYLGDYQGGLRVVDIAGELRGDLLRQGREIAHVDTGDPKAANPNAPMAWGAIYRDGHIYVPDVNSGLWIVKVEDRPSPVP